MVGEQDNALLLNDRKIEISKAARHILNETSHKTSPFVRCSFQEFQDPRDQ